MALRAVPADKHGSESHATLLAAAGRVMAEKNAQSLPNDQCPACGRKNPCVPPSSYYYKDGLEVYRDVDTDFNRRLNQCRWFYAAGTRWGVDANEDGTIAQWRSIRAEELSAELVAALVQRDPARIQPLLLSSADVASLGAGETLLKRLNQRREQTANQLAAFLKSQQAVTDAAKWASFVGGRPWLIPAGTDGAKEDVRLYERALVVVEDAGTFKHLQVGTLVQVGEAWRIVNLPRVESPTDTAQDSHHVGLFPPASPHRYDGKGSRRRRGLSEVAHGIGGDRQSGGQSSNGTIRGDIRQNELIS